MDNSFTSISQPLNLSVMGGDLQKGHIQEAFSYGSDKLKITKTGKEIKAAVGAAKSVYEQKAQQALIQCNEYKAQVPQGIVPTVEIPDYWCGNYKGLVSGMKRYTWDDCKICATSTQGNSMVPVSEDKVYSDTENSACSKYNDCLRKYCEYKAECALIDTIVNGLDDSKKYDLSIHQAAALGF